MTDVRRQPGAPPAWVTDYVGLPFAERGRERGGCDCWGLVRLVLAERFGVAAPSYAEDYDSVKDHGRLVTLIDDGKSRKWIEIWSPLTSDPGSSPGAGLCDLTSEPGDVLLLRMSGLPIHVGILVAPGWMLHTREATGAVLERFEGLAWGRRVLGIYRADARCQMSMKGNKCEISL